MVRTPGFTPAGCAEIVPESSVCLPSWVSDGRSHSPRLSCAQRRRCGKHTPRERRSARQGARPSTPKRGVAVEIPGIRLGELVVLFIRIRVANEVALLVHSR